MIINWYGTFSQGQGYSGSSEKMAIALERSGVDVRITSFTAQHPKNITKEGHVIKKKPFKLGDVGICYGFPNAFNSIQNRVKIGMTMFETDRLPRTEGSNDWSGATGQPEDAMNKMDAIIVPSEHNKELLIREGVTVPIYVVHLGYDPEIYVRMVRPARPTFTFLMYGTLTVRKNVGVVLSAFIDLFKDRQDIRLVLKTQSGTLGALELPYHNLDIIDELSTPEELFCYLRDADAFVFPSRGEGFGLPPLEAMATGLPTILADNTGMSAFCNKEYNYPVPTKETSRATRYPRKWGDIGNWCEPDYEIVKKYMLEIADNQDKAREKGAKGSEWVSKNFTYENTAQKMITVVEEVLKNKL